MLLLVAAQFNDALPLPTVDNLVTQQDVNWYLYGLINTLDAGSQVWIDPNEPPTDELGVPLFYFWWNTVEQELYVWDPLADEWKLTGLMDFDRPPIFSDSAPTEHPKFPGEPLKEGDFWFDSTRLELTVRYNDQWFPVSIPPDQIDMLNETLSGIEDNFTRVRADIARNKIDIDENLLDVTDRINSVEASIPSYDEFYLKTGGDLFGYVYSKGDNSGYYLGSEDGSLLANFREKSHKKLPWNCVVGLRLNLMDMLLVITKHSHYVDLDTSVVNGLQLNRLSDPVQSNDAVHKNYVDSKIDSIQLWCCTNKVDC